MDDPQIHVLLDDPVVPVEIATALRRIRAGVRLSRIDRELESPSNIRPDARLVVTSASNHSVAGRLAAVFAHCDRNPCATLVLTPIPVEQDSGTFGNGMSPIGFASNLSADELAGRLSAMCSFQQPLNRMRTELEALRRRDQALHHAADQIEEQMRLASQIQRDLLPDPLPYVNGLTLRTLYRPAESVSGDIYDARRLSAFNVAFSFADATGHGMPAALLTMFTKRTWQGRSDGAGPGSLRAPEEVLAALNREIVSANLSQCQFLTGLYAIYDERHRTLSWARGGAPYPILLRRGLPPQQIRSEGMLLGIDAEAAFERSEVPLEPGDVIIFHTDGLDALLLHERGRRIHDDISETPWFRDLETKTIAEQMAALNHRLAQASPADWPVDDLTVMTLQVTSRTAAPKRRGDHRRPGTALQASLA